MKRQRLYDRDFKFDDEDKLKIWDKTDGHCAHCGKEIYPGIPGIVNENHVFTVDHYIPLNKGGTHQAINLVPLCYPCNEEKDQLILEPTGYLKHLKQEYLDEISGYYESYIKSFDYLSRNNILANDVYEFTIPQVLNRDIYRSVPLKKALRLANRRSVPYQIHRASMEKLNDLTDYYIRYLKKYNGYTDDTDAKANVLWWLVNGCVYYIKDKQDQITAFIAVTTYIYDKYGTMKIPRYYFRLQPFFYYSNDKCVLMFEHLVDDITRMVMNENNLPYLRTQTVVRKEDPIIDYTRMFTDKHLVLAGYKLIHCVDIDESRCGVTGDDDDENVQKALNDEENLRITREFFDKVEINKQELMSYIHEDIYPPFEALNC